MRLRYSTGPEPVAPNQCGVRVSNELFVDGWQQAMWAGVAVMTILLVYVLARGPRRVAPLTRSQRHDPSKRVPTAC
jgi:hypothetical protein